MNLRRTITPYVGLTLIFAGITIFSVYVAHKTSQWDLMWGPAVILLLFPFAYLYFGLKYRILWDETGVYMRASGGPERHIRYEDITSIRNETAMSQSRPFRRIVIHGHKRNPNAFIDVSLRHFRLDDIEELLAKIRTCRPDLVIPAIPAGRRIL